MKKIIKFILKLSLIYLLILPAIPVWAVTKSNSKPIRLPLTLELLDIKLTDLAQKTGSTNLDLTNLIIDLTNQNAEFREQFYQKIQQKLNGYANAITLDLSGSLIQGEFNSSRLGLRTALNPTDFLFWLTESEQTQLAKDQDFFPNVGAQIPTVTVWRGALKLNHTLVTGKVDFDNTLFLQRVEVEDAIFGQAFDCSSCRFLRLADFSRTAFSQAVDFSGSRFVGQAIFKQAKFENLANFTGSTFIVEANFREVTWRDRTLFSQTNFHSSLNFSNSTLERASAFRNSIFSGLVDWQNVKLLEQVDFSGAVFAPDVTINVAGLGFDSEKAKILGQNGVIGFKLTVPKLTGNENVLRNLVRNFRSLEQIPDANALEYQREQLRLIQIGHELITTPLQQIISWYWLAKVLKWLGLSLLLLLSDYGTNAGLVLGIGIAAIAYFALLYWLVDRYRPGINNSIIPTKYETSAMAVSFSLLSIIAIVDINQSSFLPWLTWTCLSLILLPIPLLLLIWLYLQGRYHDLIDVTYFVEDGELRQLRLMIARLPIMPRFPFYRDRYLPLLWDRRWHWLNYYDFSLNNLFKFGFNDIRMRDKYLPGIISTLVWYQWALGMFYIILLLWTLSRTIPGLNLLIYL